MAKAAAVHFSCAECGYSTGRWLGRCPGCGSFGTLAEEAPPAEMAPEGAAPEGTTEAPEEAEEDRPA